MSFVRFRFSPTGSFSTPINRLKVIPSDQPVRPRFRNGSDVFLTPSSTLKTPSSWPPRPDSTGLRPTCAAGHVVSIFPLNAYNGHQTPCRDPVVMSPCPSWNVFLAFEHEGDVDFEFRQGGSYILKRSVFSKSWAFLIFPPNLKWVNTQKRPIFGKKLKCARD